MEIKKEIIDGICTLVPEGRIDTLTSGDLEAAVAGAAEECGKIILDMSDVDYVSSAGIRVIIQAHRNAGENNLILKNVAKNVFQLFAMTGFDRVLNFE